MVNLWWSQDSSPAQVYRALFLLQHLQQQRNPTGKGSQIEALQPFTKPYNSFRGEVKASLGS